MTEGPRLHRPARPAGLHRLLEGALLPPPRVVAEEPVVQLAPPTTIYSFMTQSCLAVARVRW
jgi:hypothetical protein